MYEKIKDDIKEIKKEILLLKEHHLKCEEKARDLEEVIKKMYEYYVNKSGRL